MKQSIRISQQSHRNPSTSKIHRSCSRKNSEQLNKYSASKIPTTSHTSYAKVEGKQKKFLNQCFEHVYIQHLALNQEVSRKKKQYAYLVFQCERLKKLNRSKQKIGHEEFFIINQTQEHKKTEYKASLSSIQSVGDSSLISQKFIPIQDHNHTSNELSSRDGQSPKKYLQTLKQNLQDLQLEKFNRN